MDSSWVKVLSDDVCIDAKVMRGLSGWEIPDEGSEILSAPMLSMVNSKVMPRYYQMEHWERLFSCKSDGSSLRSLFSRCERKGPLLFLIHPLHSPSTICIGAFLDTGLERTQFFSGTKSTRVFAVYNDECGEEFEVKVYPSANVNNFYIHCSDKGIGIGGGSNYALHIDEVCPSICLIERT